MEHKKFYTVAEIYRLIELSNKIEKELNDEAIINVCKWAGTTPEQRWHEVRDEIKWIFDHIDEDTKSKVIRYGWNDMNYACGIYGDLVDGREKIYIND